MASRTPPQHLMCDVNFCSATLEEVLSTDTSDGQKDLEQAEVSYVINDPVENYPSDGEVVESIMDRNRCGDEVGAIEMENEAASTLR